MLNVKIHLLSDKLDAVYKKSKYHGLFDIAVLSVYSASKLKELEFAAMMKTECKIYVEMSKFFVIFKPE